MAPKFKKLARFWPLYLMLLPGTAYLVINNYIPMTGIVVAFKQYNLRDGLYFSPNVGLKNFEFLFKTNDAWLITRNIILYNLVFIVLGVVLAITVAIILNEIRIDAAKQAYQTVILIPHLISMVVVSYLAFAFLSDGNGFLNKSVLPLLGMEPVSWYNAPQYWPFILVLINVWKGVVLCDDLRHRPQSVRGRGGRRRQPLAADLEHHAAVPEIHHHHFDADEYRQHFPHRFRPVLSGADEFRPFAERDEHHRYIRVPRPDADEQHRHVLGGRRISVRRRLCPCDFRESHCPQAG